MTGLFRKKHKKVEKADFVEDGSSSLGRVDTVPSHSDPITSPEIKDIDTVLSQLRNNLREQKSNVNKTNFMEGFSGNWMPSTSQNVITAKTLVAQTESSIRDLELERAKLTRFVAANNSIPQSSTSTLPLSVDSTPSVTSTKGSLPKGVTPSKSEVKKQPSVSPQSESEPLRILKIRFAKGEITKDEFLEMKNTLEKS